MYAAAYLLFLAGIFTFLKYPYPRDVKAQDKYATGRVHADLGKSRGQSSLRAKENLPVSTQNCS